MSLHLGEISLECSRAGAAAAALWLTRKVVPWTIDGLGARLAAGQRAAQHWRSLLGESDALTLYQDADLDIVTFLPRHGSVAEVGVASHGLFDRAMNDPNDPVFIATYGVSADALLRRHPRRVRDADTSMILRSVVMKPENETNIEHLHRRLETLAAPTP